MKLQKNSPENESYKRGRSAMLCGTGSQGWQISCLVMFELKWVIFSFSWRILLLFLKVSTTDACTWALKVRRAWARAQLVASHCPYHLSKDGDSAIWILKEHHLKPPMFTQDTLLSSKPSSNLPSSLSQKTWCSLVSFSCFSQKLYVVGIP